LNSLELVFKGTRISPGLASGTVWVSGDILDYGAEAYRIEPDQVEAEMERIRRAFGQVEAELEEAAQRLSEQIDPGLAEIFRAHHLMLENLLSSNEFERELRGSLVGAAEAVKKVFRKWEAKFAAIENETFRQRADDILDLARRVLRQLQGIDAFGLAGMPVGSILVTQRPAAIRRSCHFAQGRERNCS
jgi:phosphotransferase system enzyme I (PtsI)